MKKTVGSGWSKTTPWHSGGVEGFNLDLEFQPQRKPGTGKEFYGLQPAGWICGEAAELLVISVSLPSLTKLFKKYQRFIFAVAPVRGNS